MTMHGLSCTTAMVGMHGTAAARQKRATRKSIKGLACSGGGRGGGSSWPRQGRIFLKNKHPVLNDSDY